VNGVARGRLGDEAKKRLRIVGRQFVECAPPLDLPAEGIDLHADTIVTDLPIPTYDGWQFLEDLKQNSRTRDIPLVAVSSYVLRSLREHAERNGFAAFFPKPCPPDELAAGLRQVLDRNAHAHVER
jgi:CheY-like chemotaxis protein